MIMRVGMQYRNMSRQLLQKSICQGKGPASGLSGQDSPGLQVQSTSLLMWCAWEGLSHLNHTECTEIYMYYSSQKETLPPSA